MKKLIPYFLLVALIALQASFVIPTKEPAAYSKWLNYHGLQHQDFQEFGIEIENRFNWINYNLSDKYIEIFKPFRIYNSDSTYFLDLDTYSLGLEKQNNKLISYGSEVDIKVQIINTTDSKISTILFCGTNCYTETAFWLHDNTIQILGFSLENEKFIPTKWSFNTDKESLIKYQARKTFEKMPKNYSELVRLKSVTFKY